MAAGGSAGEGVGLQYGRQIPTEVYDTPTMFLLGVFWGLRFLGTQAPPLHSPWVSPLEAPPQERLSSASFTSRGLHFVKTAIRQRKQIISKKLRPEALRF